MECSAIVLCMSYLIVMALQVEKTVVSCVLSLLLAAHSHIDQWTVWP